MTTRRVLVALLVAIIIVVVGSIGVAAAPSAQGGGSTSLTYQGVLSGPAGNVTDACDFEFRLYNAETGGNQVSATASRANVEVINGLFTAPLDFGLAAFDGSNRWLQMDVGCPTGIGQLSALTPRQLITSAPYAMFAPVALVAGFAASTTAPPYTPTLDDFEAAARARDDWPYAPDSLVQNALDGFDGMAGAYLADSCLNDVATSPAGFREFVFDTGFSLSMVDASAYLRSLSADAAEGANPACSGLFAFPTSAASTDPLAGLVAEAADVNPIFQTAFRRGLRTTLYTWFMGDRTEPMVIWLCESFVGDC